MNHKKYFAIIQNQGQNEKMKAKRILFITQEIIPFVPESSYALVGRYLPQAVLEEGCEIRTFCPRWGIINERRNSLHEVIRLSGMNLIIDETDHPLILKCASIQSTRMPIYFIDNDDLFFKRGITADKAGNEYDDNGERAIFYARGVIETVKKLRWEPEVIFCQGWVTALAPIYLKKAYADEPWFRDSKVVFSTCGSDFQKEWGPEYSTSAAFGEATKEDIDAVCEGKYYHDDILKLAAKYSDGFIYEDTAFSDDVRQYITGLGIPTMQRPEQKNEYHAACIRLFDQVLDTK